MKRQLFIVSSHALTNAGPYDLRDAEKRNPVIKTNVQFNEECYGICQCLDEFIKSRSLHLNQITIWTSICKYYMA